MQATPLAARALLFDLDGTLVDSVADIAAAANQAMCALGLPQRPTENLCRWVGNGSRKLIERTLTGDRDGIADPELLDRALSLFFDAYAERVWDKSRCYPGVIETLERLRDAGFALACVTNKPERHTELLLEASGLSPLLSVRIGGDSLPVRKPDPGQLLEAARRLGVTPDDCVMVGDSVNDIGAGRAAGMAVICLSYGYNQGEDLVAHGPDQLLDRFADIPKQLVMPGRKSANA